ncbi:MAG: acyltransferase [Thermodesulfobacteriota bacterium]
MEKTLNACLLFFAKVNRSVTSGRGRLLWAWRCGHYGKGVTIDRHVRISNPERVFLGDFVQLNQGVVLRPGHHEIHIGASSGINPYVTIYGKVRIGRYAMIAPHVMIAGGNHVYDRTDIPMIKIGRSINLGVIIEDDVWLGANAVVLDGVTIGTGAIVSAGAVVVADVAPYDIVAGNPARVIKNRKTVAQER